MGWVESGKMIGFSPAKTEVAKAAMAKTELMKKRMLTDYWDCLGLLEKLINECVSCVKM